MPHLLTLQNTGAPQLHPKNPLDLKAPLSHLESQFKVLVKNEKGADLTRVSRTCLNFTNSFDFIQMKEKSVVSVQITGYFVKSHHP